MARALRNLFDNNIYHILNRSNNRELIFRKELDYFVFENILKEGKKKYPVKILSYCIMPNHWHLVVETINSKDLISFMKWITVTHTIRWRTHYKNIGYGHLYQGRYKSILVKKDNHFLQLCRYVERNPLRVNLIQIAEDWRWSSLWIRKYGSIKQNEILSKWPLEQPVDYIEWVNQPDEKDEVVLDKIRISISKNIPFGDDKWIRKNNQKINKKNINKILGRPRKTIKNIFQNRSSNSS